MENLNNNYNFYYGMRNILKDLGITNLKNKIIVRPIPKKVNLNGKSK